MLIIEKGVSYLIGRGAMEEMEKTKAKSEQAKEKVLAIVNKIIATLEQDIQAYVVDKVKEVFLDNFDYVQNMSQDKVAGLKKDTQATAEKAKAEIGEALASIDKWLVKEKAAGYRSSILQNKEILEIVKKVEIYIYGVLSSYNFPEEIIALSDIGPYSLSDFSSGKILEELSKNYWKEVAEYYKLKMEVDHLEAEAKREAARKIWDQET